MGFESFHIICSKCSSNPAATSELMRHPSFRPGLPAPPGQLGFMDFDKSVIELCRINERLHFVVPLLNPIESMHELHGVLTRLKENGFKVHYSIDDIDVTKPHSEDWFRVAHDSFEQTQAHLMDGLGIKATFKSTSSECTEVILQHIYK